MENILVGFYSFWNPSLMAAEDLSRIKSFSSKIINIMGKVKFFIDFWAVVLLLVKDYNQVNPYKIWKAPNSVTINSTLVTGEAMNPKTISLPLMSHVSHVPTFRYNL